jgi:hypothetical protein
MRKGGKRIDWTTADERYLIANAGRIPKRDICQHLKRSGRSVTRKAEQLRGRGIPVYLRHYETTLYPCPSCGYLSGHLDRDGICEPCRRREQLENIHARIASLLPLLPIEERDKYEQTEAETESRHDPMPKAPNTSGLSFYEKQKAEEAHAIAIEEWVSANLRREIKAAQKRKERIEKKVKSMGLLPKSPDGRTK